MNLPVKSLVWSVLGMTFIPYKTYETACNTIALRVSKSHCTKDKMLASTTAHRPVGKECMIQPRRTNNVYPTTFIKSTFCQSNEIEKYTIVRSPKNVYINREQRVLFDCLINLQNQRTPLQTQFDRHIFRVQIVIMYYMHF